MIAALLLLAVSCGKDKGSKILVLYYSQTGNTEVVAKQLQSALGADIEAITPVAPYDGDFQATIERGRKELEEGTLPEIKPLASDIKSYDVIFLGFPVWFGTYANPVATVLANYDFNGKKVVPFCTFGSGGLDSSTRDIKEKIPGAEVLPGYGVRAARIEAVPAEVDRFLKEEGFIPGEKGSYEAFSDFRDVTEEESAIFDAAVGDYPMIRAKASEVSSRNVPGGIEYIFRAKDLPRPMPGVAPADMPAPRTMEVHVLAEDGKAPVFTKVIR